MRRAAGLLTIVALSLAGALPARAVDGWREDFGGLSHYTGLSCPDRIGALERFEVAGSTATMLASCTYRSGGLYLIIQLWEPGYLAQALQTFRDRFAAIGFKQVAGSSFAERGVTFSVGGDDGSERRETLWPITIGNRGLVLWMNYAYPSDEPRMEMSYTDVVEMLRATK